jgi:hypothetical protein
MTSMYLDPDTWDLDVDASRNIALAGDPYATAQSVANACRLWRGEAPYDSIRGIPYETEILGQQPAPRLLAGWYEEEAGLVPGVASVVAMLQFTRPERRLTGQIQCTLTNGTVINV